MKAKMFTIAILFLLVQVSHSQSPDTVKNSLKKGKWALMFQVGNNFTLRSFDDLLFSLKYHLSDRSALRFGVGYEGQQTDGDVKESGVETPIIPKSHQSVLFIFNYLYYFSPTARINLFVGIGPRFSYYFDYTEYYVGFGVDAWRTISWNAGLSGILGAEWFPTTSLSLFGEYDASATYGKTEQKSRNNDGHLIVFNYHGLEFNGNTARLGVSLYFDFPF